MQVIYCLFPQVISVSSACPTIFISCVSSQLNKLGSALVNPEFMDGASLLVGVFKREKWYYVRYICLCNGLLWYPLWVKYTVHFACLTIICKTAKIFLAICKDPLTIRLNCSVNLVEFLWLLIFWLFVLFEIADILILCYVSVYLPLFIILRQLTFFVVSEIMILRYNCYLHLHWSNQLSICHLNIDSFKLSIRGS